MFAKRSIRHKPTAWLAAAFAIPLALAAAAAAVQLDWHAIDSEVGQRLLDGDNNLVQWAGELSASEPATARDALVKLCVSMRAALDDEACDAVVAFWRTGEDNFDDHLVANCYYAATDRYLAWDVARTIAEVCAPRIHELELENRLIRHFRGEDNPRRWSDEEFIAWLDARVESVRCHDRERKAVEAAGPRAPGFDAGQVRPIQFWCRLRLRQLAAMGRVTEELERMADDVRSSPAGAGPALEYLFALKELRGSPGKPVPPQLDWLPGACRPGRATELQQLASLLVELGQYQQARIFYQRAIDAEITREEIARLSAMCQTFLPEQTHRRLFEVRLREELASVLLKLGETERAQRVMLEAADLRTKHQLPPNPYLSGAVQAQSGARVIEGRIRDKERANKDDPDYWLERAEYFRGRGEGAEEESALRRGLALCPPAPQPRGKAPLEMRLRLLTCLARLLVRDNRHAEAAQLLLKELEAAPLDTASSAGAARLLAFDLPEQVDSNEPILWNWLARREKWDNPEERLIWRMLESAPKRERSKHFDRAERLALAPDADASRAATLGWVLNRMEEAERSVRLLRHAVAAATDEELQQRAGFTLFESYLDLKDWRAAESMFGQAAKRLTPSEDPEWLGRIAVAAAEQGAAGDAMRIFRRVANCNLRPRQLVDALSRLGLEDELRGFYAGVRERLPAAKLDFVAGRPHEP